MSNQFTRRELLQKGSMIAVGLAAPSWLATIAEADVFKLSKGKPIIPDGILVVCQLSGGNDGLNSVIPFSDPEYYRLRPRIGIPEDQVLRVTDRMGFHPSLKGLETLYREKKVAVIQGVGYPQPNRSHFRSMDIWHAASPDLTLKQGWIGRHSDLLNREKPLNPVYALGLSTEKPRALNSKDVSIPCFASLADIQSMVGNADAEKMLRDINAGSLSASQRVVQDANTAALNAMIALRDQLDNYKTKESYGESKFGEGFKQIAQLIATSPMTRVVYFSTGGFDTHANQPDQHGKLLQGFGDAILAFQREMEACGKAEKVTVLVFSEFGRRSYENASSGTDHGAAAPMFLVGKPVKGGFYGPIPDFTNLMDGDLRYGIDFREVYATALDQWMGSDSSLVLGGKYNSLPVFNV